MARYELVPQDSQVWIEGSSSVHPIHATATGLEGFVDLAMRSGKVVSTTTVTGSVQIAVDALRSGNPLVDRETRRRIDARRFPHIVGEVLAAEVAGPNRIALTGRIDFRGQSQEVQGSLDVTVDGDDLLVEGEQTFDVRAWGLQPPKIALLKVSPEIRVRIRLRATKA